MLCGFIIVRSPAGFVASSCTSALLATARTAAMLLSLLRSFKVNTALRRPKRGRKAQQAAAAAAAADGGALDSIPETGAAPAEASAPRGAAAKPAVSDDDTLGGGLSLMDRLAGACTFGSGLMLCIATLTLWCE